MIGATLARSKARANDLRRAPMIRKLLIAVFGLALVAGMTVPANAATHPHRHHRHYRHHR